MNILTFDIEDWFHIEFEDSIKKWDSYEHRIHKNINYIFNALERNETKATFFCLGWVAERFPEIIKEISKRGYEVGSHSYDHKLVFKKSPAIFKADVEHSINLLEDITGKKIKCFRAPAFSITEQNMWAFEILAELGVEYDSSIFPANRDYGGFPSFSPARPTKFSYKGITIKEFPINLTSFLGKEIIFSGGGYFRLLPYNLIKYFTNKSDYTMAYFHPRDFDPNQPILKNLNLNRRFKSYVGLKSSYSKFQRFLTDFEFTDIQGANQMIKWEEQEILNLS